ncbi:hypothetical protein F5Y02DRAFT_68995 [Annulohypoxylon stygium]|nr:hypothetical protein F5Y02DRAFT_68995 [Annulohypoxylon stygium]
MASDGLPANITDYLLQPYQIPPPGVTSNFANPDGSHSLGYFVVIFGAVLSTNAVLLRLGSSYVLNRIVLEDALLLCALGTFGGYEWVLYVTAITPGVKVHSWDYQMKDIERYRYHLHIASICYGPAVMFLKIAILYDWLRIFLPTRQRNAMFWSLHILIWGNAIYYISGTFLEIFRCTPRQKIWDPLFVGGSCPIDIAANNFVSALINLVSDLAILAVPQWVIWRLQMSMARKIGVSLLFVIGIFATVCGIFRLVSLLEILFNNDETYWTTELGLWGVGEITAGFLIIGIPSMPKIIKNFPVTNSLVSLMKSWTRNMGSSNPSQEGVGLPIWRNPLSRKRRGQWEISELDTYGLVTLDATQNVESGYATDSIENHPSHGTTKEVAVEATAPTTIG